MTRRSLLLAASLAVLLAAPAFAREGYNAGDRCPDFQLYDTEGKPTRLSDFRGKVVLLHFIATW
ncbi:MAG: peroxiredoxin family protein [Planctomycetota bacterium]|jgi:cytochrome oxidase Cu insertion factor (SCO1/SenC/PrrC family)